MTIEELRQQFNPPSEIHEAFQIKYHSHNSIFIDDTRRAFRQELERRRERCNNDDGTDPSLSEEYLNGLKDIEIEDHMLLFSMMTPEQLDEYDKEHLEVYGIQCCIRKPDAKFLEYLEGAKSRYVKSYEEASGE